MNIKFCRQRTTHFSSCIFFLFVWCVCVSCYISIFTFNFIFIQDEWEYVSFIHTVYNKHTEIVPKGMSDLYDFRHSKCAHNVTHWKCTLLSLLMYFVLLPMQTENEGEKIITRVNVFVDLLCKRYGSWENSEKNKISKKNYWFVIFSIFFSCN